MTRRPIPWLLAGFLLALNVADLGLTIYLLGNGAHEVNPIANFFIGLGGIPALIAMKLLVSAGSCTAMLHNYDKKPSLHLVAMSLAIVLIAAVVAWNLHMVAIAP